MNTLDNIKLVINKNKTYNSNGPNGPSIHALSHIQVRQNHH